MFDSRFATSRDSIAAHASATIAEGAAIFPRASLGAAAVIPAETIVGAGAVVDCALPSSAVAFDGEIVTDAHAVDDGRCTAENVADAIDYLAGMKTLRDFASLADVFVSLARTERESVRGMIADRRKPDAEDFEDANCLTWTPYRFLAGPLVRLFVAVEVYRLVARIAADDARAVEAKAIADAAIERASRVKSKIEALETAAELDALACMLRGLANATLVSPDAALLEAMGWRADLMADA